MELLLIILLEWVTFPQTALASEKGTTDQLTIIQPSNPMAYPNSPIIMPNTSYYFQPANPTPLYNPNIIPPHHNSYPSPIDSAITNKIQNLYEQNTILIGCDLRVVTNDGIVTLDGTVESQNQIDEANRVAESVNGVKNVVSNVSISPID